MLFLISSFFLFSFKNASFSAGGPRVGHNRPVTVDDPRLDDDAADPRDDDDDDGDNAADDNDAVRG